MSLFRAALSIFTFAFAVSAGAAAPMAKTAAPGFQRIMLGDFEVTALSDGTADLPMDKLLTNTTSSTVEQAAREDVPQEPGRDLGQRLPREHRREAGADRHGCRRVSSAPRSASWSPT